MEELIRMAQELKNMKTREEELELVKMKLTFMML
nr:hypothetical protein [uncultured Clostridium sp.]